MTTELTIIDPKQYGLEKKQSTEITKNLTPILKEREFMMVNYARIVKSEITPELISEARETRLLLAKNRTKGILLWHKVNKEFYLRGGQFCDAIKRKEAEVNERAESQLLEIELHDQRIEERRLEDLQVERSNELSLYLLDDEERNLSSMETDVWNAFISTKKKEYEDRVAAEKKAETDRIAKEKAEKAERERIKKENEALKIEADKKATELQAERAKVEKERKEAEVKAKKEAEAKAKVEAELQAKKDVEIKAQEELKAATELELSKGDKEKFQTVIEDLTTLKTKYSFKSQKYQKLHEEVNELIDKIIVFSESKSE